LDSVNFGSLASSRWPHQIGYVNGHVSAWTAEEIAETRAAGRLLALVDVLGTAPLSASILDFERGDVQSPTVVRAWLQARNQYRGDGTVYCSVASIPAVVGGLRGERCNLWVADLTADSEPPFTVPDYPGLPAGVRVIARQFALTPRTGGPYDMSIVYADDWHPEQPEPGVFAAARISAAAELGPYAVAAVRASATGAAVPEIPGQLTIGGADPKLSSPDGPTSSEPLSAPSSPTSTASEPGEPTSDATAAAPADPAATAAAADPGAWRIGQFTMPTPPTQVTTTPPAPVQVMVPMGGSTPPIQPVAVLGDDGRDSGRTVFEPAAAARPLTAAEQNAAHLEVHWARQAARSAPSSPSSLGSATSTAAAAPTGPLNHDFIRATLTGLEGVALEFRRGGWSNIAAELERVAGVAWEIGGAIRAAGL
jgi:hypothetical protein